MSYILPQTIHIQFISMLLLLLLCSRYAISVFNFKYSHYTSFLQLRIYTFNSRYTEAGYNQILAYSEMRYFPLIKTNIYGSMNTNGP